MIDYVLQIVTSPTIFYIIWSFLLCYMAYQAGVVSGFKRATLSVKTAYRDTFVFPNGTYGFFTEDHKTFILIDQNDFSISRVPVEGAAERDKENQVAPPPRIITDDDSSSNLQ